MHENKIPEQEQCITCQGKGCADCGNTGVESMAVSHGCRRKKQGALMDIRFCVVIDFEQVNSLKGAYNILHKTLTNAGLNWESTEEAYMNGMPIGKTNLEEMRMNHFKK